MLILLASLAFAATALIAMAAIGSTWTRYGKTALGHVAALRDVAEERTFRVRIVGGTRPALAGHPGIRRLPHRAAAVRLVRRVDAQRVAA
jgi:hypothetical protein